MNLCHCAAWSHHFGATTKDIATLNDLLSGKAENRTVCQGDDLYCFCYTRVHACVISLTDYVESLKIACQHCLRKWTALCSHLLLWSQGLISQGGPQGHSSNSRGEWPLLNHSEDPGCWIKQREPEKRPLSCRNDPCHHTGDHWQDPWHLDILTDGWITPRHCHKAGYLAVTCHRIYPQCTHMQIYQIRLTLLNTNHA